MPSSDRDGSAQLFVDDEPQQLRDSVLRRTELMKPRCLEVTERFKAIELSGYLGLERYQLRPEVGISTDIKPFEGVLRGDSQRQLRDVQREDLGARTTECRTGDNAGTTSGQGANSRYDMVAGSVAPPRLDLTNEALLASHLYAVWLSETGADLHARMPQLLELEEPGMALIGDLAKTLNNPDAIRRATDRANAVIAPFIDDDLRQTSWWHDGWTAAIISGAPEEFDKACNRWRDLYQAALDDQAEQVRVGAVGVLVTQQPQLTFGFSTAAFGGLASLRFNAAVEDDADFYTYRYFASEGFLPGYSFPRLPLAAYIPGVRVGTNNRDGGEYLQRPRFLAISEFGPGAIIYHEGARYEIRRIQLPMSVGGVGTVETQDAYRCESCGYHHVRRPGLDVCENCAAALGAPQYGLMRMQTGLRPSPGTHFQRRGGTPQGGLRAAHVLPIQPAWATPRAG